jgi:hypothetical protein
MHDVAKKYFAIAWGNVEHPVHAYQGLHDHNYRHVPSPEGQGNQHPLQFANVYLVTA